MTETLRLITPVLGASTLAWVAYYLVNNLRLRPKVGRPWKTSTLQLETASRSSPAVNRSGSGSRNVYPFLLTPGKSTSSGPSAAGISKAGGSVA